MQSRRYRYKQRTSVLLWGTISAIAFTGVACSDDGGDPPVVIDAAVAIDSGTQSDAAVELTEWEVLLEAREYNFNAALRTASLRLTGQLPTLAQIKFVADGANIDEQRAAYESQVRSMLDSPRFASQARKFWQDTFKMGDDPVLDTGPTFAAQLTVEERPFTELFTASENNCPTFDGTTFTPATCDTGAPAEAGILTNRGFHKQFFGNMAFRRARWLQETFDCTAFPAEISGMPVDVGGPALYTGVWPYDVLAGADNGGRVDFRDRESINCGNCHSTINHICPLIGKFDADGSYVSDGYGVTLPTGEITEFTDWLTEGERTGWRAGTYADDLPALGQEMANDPEVMECMVIRVWNWGFGRGDIVDTLAVIPEDIIAQQIADFTANNHNIKELIYQVFTSEDFVLY